ncbi:MAG: aspartate carbamoyltransferase regulatory subunit [Muribaculaceae bacterium]|nr:aspartate carbamoyltransferase regulatory subunit [Muribaculaceae bacterium]
MSNKKELAVAALRNGTVIDHIPSEALFRAVRILGIEKLKVSVTIGNNLASSRFGHKGIIKVADTEFSQEALDRIAIIAPTAVVNTIRDYEVVEKRPVVLPDVLCGIVRCGNPKCITNNEPMSTRFIVVDRDKVTLRCAYCTHTFNAENSTFVGEK